MTAEGEPKRPWPIGPRGRMVMAGALVAALAIGLWIWQHYAPPLPSDRPRTVTAPPAQRGPVRPAKQQPIRRPEPIDTCSVPGLERGVPQLVPGLEAVRVGYCISLTDDLCTIAFAKVWPRSPHHGLYLADRPSISSPFGEPRAIESVGDPPGLSNSLPQLSSDGLELIFARGNDSFYCRRTSRSAEFGDPALWLPADSVGEGRKLIMLRFLDPLRVLISAQNLNARESYAFFIRERADPQSEFGPPKEIVLGFRARPNLWMRPDLLRAYYGMGGIYRQVRKTVEEPFDDSLILFKAPVCGRVPGGVWVTPAEDVIFYASPGPANDPAGEKHVWMIRF